MRGLELHRDKQSIMRRKIKEVVSERKQTINIAKIGVR